LQLRRFSEGADADAQIGYLLPAQEAALTAAIHAAFDLD